MDERAAIEQLRTLSTAVVSDALDRLGLTGQVPSLGRLSGAGTIAGPAFTVRYEATRPGRGTVGDYIDDVEPGSVVVLANAGRLDATVWGGILSETAARREVAGTVIDGVCRDLERARTVGYSLFARAGWMRTGKDRVHADAVQAPVSMCGVLVAPGDLVVGDADGVLVIGADRVADVLEVATTIEAAEQAISERVAGGQRLDQARAELGYFALQRNLDDDDAADDTDTDR